MAKLTADICDALIDNFSLCDPLFADYGGNDTFEGVIVTLRTFEDNGLICDVLEEDGTGKVLVVDGGGSMRRALTGGNVAETAVKNGWAGILFNGCVRDIREIEEQPIGIKALGSTPVRPHKDRYGERNVAVSFAGVTFQPGHYLYADADGVIVTPKPVA